MPTPTENRARPAVLAHCFALLASVVLASALAAPVHAQTDEERVSEAWAEGLRWQADARPQQDSSGRPQCSLFLSDRGANGVLVIVDEGWREHPERQVVSIISPQIAGLAAPVSGSVGSDFPRVPVAEFRLRTTNNLSAATAILSDTDFDTLMNAFVFGDMLTVELGGLTLTYHLNSAAGSASALMECRRTLFVSAATAGAQTDEERVARAEALLAEAEGLERQSAEQTDNKSAAIRLATPACDRNHAPACVTLGRAHLVGAGSAMFGGVQVPEAVAAFTRACDLGSGEGCFELGDYHDPTGLFGNTNTLENWRGAASGFRRACEDHQMAEGCERYRRVMEASSNRDTAAVLAYRQARCADGDQPSCEIADVEGIRFSAARQIGTQRPAMDCAAALGTVVLINPQESSTARGYVRTLINAHINANSADFQVPAYQVLENQAAGAARQRLQAVQSGQETIEAINQDIAACIETFGL
ncbi:MAG: hypothetical protein GC187_04205 [Alphaproteobacteria bacterium]|nr:hypothetical protein [Alphaproteobacteria bacterium]